jgi:chromosome partitioning protein
LSRNVGGGATMERGMAARVITVAQQKGGAGKTTLAVTLGLTALEFGHRVALVDIDPQGSLTQWSALRQANPDLPRILVSTVTGWRAANEISRLSRDHDLIVVDSPPHALTDAKIAMRAAHLVVVPVQPSPLDIWATRPTLDFAEGEHKKPVLVLNRVPQRSPIAGEMAAAVADLGARLAQAKLGNRASFAASMAGGRSVRESAPGTIGAREAAKLTREILSLAGF